ncbi:zinc finger CCCH domain-containing protein 14 isoform X2 [Latimeria chalumnae]|uniref:zinc finger CCCH domain-containing protein 14 isoform X2 n=1 Tax=Latimeria chalumnae TaxID=7897 RepID=UPI0003C16922|nr:PREDICTED: zinc finger CCCH domain-containing protein 14 isoform X2 [Latimeria chalumnae]|eukprot:XP_005986585.1 PREDICTED: zinc finger CCCH domain-containing protein 14 isoform X2 [Latimeria chalumnae]
MEIGTEISRKIRAAIKGKLQELGAYVDEELPDYIMVMVANKKSQEQMTDDLSLFLGSNTVKFTVWLHGVLDKLRSVTTEPPGLKTSHSVFLDTSTTSGTGRVAGVGDKKAEESHPITSIRSERTDLRVSTSSSQEPRVTSLRSSPAELNPSRLMSTVKPLMESPSTEAVIDIKPEPDDDLIDEDLNFVQEVPTSRKKPVVTVTYSSSRAPVDVHRPSEGAPQPLRQPLRIPLPGAPTGRQPDLQIYRPPEAVRASESESYSRLAESYRLPSRQGLERTSTDEEVFRRRRAPVISSVVKVTKLSDDGEEEDEDYELRTGGLSSSVSVPPKPERRPTLPPNKQANKNLILKAISEAQESVSKTTSYPPVASQKQMVPVAPRTRMTPELEVIHVQEKSVHLSSQLQMKLEEEQAVHRPPGALSVAQQRQLLSRLQAAPEEQTVQTHQEVRTVDALQPLDTRSFILKKPVLEEVTPPSQEVSKPYPAELVQQQDRLIQSRDPPPPPARVPSPKFIVTLDGVPSPPGYTSDQEEEEEMTSLQQIGTPSKETRKHRLQQTNVAARDLGDSDVEMEDVSVPVKRQKLLERCKYWPACKNGSECLFHHPTTQCKTFPSCKFGEKCLFIHPNCKYDAKCTKPDCPFTHASRRNPAPVPKPAPVSASTTSVCRFFPECKKMDCPFYHPKHCRFGMQCKRPGCTFYHPSVSVPPRHALKWTRSNSSNE